MAEYALAMDRRRFLLSIVGAAGLSYLPALGFAATAHRYKLVPENILPEDLKKYPDEIREAYRFAVANRNTLRYIPCYCGCGEQGHTSNASCYVKDNSPPGKIEFDSMSVG